MVKNDPTPLGKDEKDVMEGEWGAILNSLWPRYHPIWFKTSILKDCVTFQTTVGEKN